MKKYSAFLMAMAFLFAGNAQIEIDSGDMPGVGDVYIRSNAPVIGDFNLDGGENLTWDYSFLESMQNDSLNFVSVGGAPFAYQFLFNNPFIPEYLADLAQNLPDVDFGGVITLENFYSFYQNNPDSYLQLGTGIQVNGVPGAGTNEPIDTVYRFPLNFEDMDSSYTELDIEIPGLYSYHQEQTRTNFVDGWGTLILPTGSFEVLRVRTELESVDSVFVELLELGFSFPQPLQIQYKWLAQEEGYPILQINEQSGFVTEVQYKDTLVFNPDYIEEIGLNEINISPNPAGSEINIELPPNVRQFDLKVFSIDGKLVMDDQKLSSLQSLDISSLNDGRYMIVIESTSGIFTGSFIKEN